MTVSQLNRYVKMSLEGDRKLSNLFLCGEISNCKRNNFSGHIYFSLKDESALIKCAMFKSNAARLKFEPQDGMSVICRGRVSLYERDGAYQFYASDMQPDGAGAAAVAFEQIKNKLEAEGLFAAERKRAIPKFPKKIAAVTSDTGAALRDIINIISRRWPIAEIMICPVTVQGETAADSMIKMLDRVYKTGVDTIIIGRGGGSAEDLSAFNDEALARKIAESPIPIISAVGHETDFSISDFAADLRAPTPSAAAELAVPDIRQTADRLNSLYSDLIETELSVINDLKQRVDRLRERPAFKNPMYTVDALSERLSRAEGKLTDSFKLRLSEYDNRLVGAVSKLDALNPLKVLKRGYAAVSADKKQISSVGELSVGGKIELTLCDGSAFCTVDDIKQRMENRVDG